MRQALLGLALLAILGFLGLAGEALYRHSAGAGASVAAGAAGAGKVFGSGQLIDGPPHPAPPLSVTLFAGGAWDLAAQRGRPVLLNFWASWCPPCRQEVPVLQQAYQTYHDRVAFLGVDVWDTDHEAQAFLSGFHAGYPNGADPAGRIAIDYGLTGVPETFLLDRAGRVVHHYVGPLDATSLEALLAPLVS